MKTITINAVSKRVVERKKQEKELKYYCFDLQKMYIFKAGKLKYDYQYNEQLKKNIIVPIPVDIEYQISQIKSNMDDIKKWANNNLNYSYAEVISINKDSVMFSVPDNEIEDFTGELDRQRFEYNVS